MPELTPADPNITPYRYSAFWFRFLEILPGATVWLALLLPFLLAAYFPLQVTLFVVVFDAYWLQKALYTAYRLGIGYARMRKNLRTDWKADCQELSELTPEQRQQMGVLDPAGIYHAVILTTYKEDEEIVDGSIRSLVESNFDHSRLIMVLATEGRDAENARRVAASLERKYAEHFFKFIVTEHPDGILGEVKAKGANASWAARELVRQMENEAISLDKVVVTIADADTHFIPIYFDCLTYRFAVTPDRLRCSYQPIATFLNNVWTAPMISRVMAFSTTFWHLAESVNEYRLLTFSTHAVSLQTLVDINFWCTSVVNEDSRQFFRAYFHYQGKFRSIPLFMPVQMDAVYVSSPIGTYKNLYLQQQRWAYGVEHFPYIVLESLRQHKIPWLNRLMLVWRAYFGSFSWGTNAFFISIVGWLPLVLNHAFKAQVAASNFPLVTHTLLEITWVGIIISNIVSLQLLPPPPKKHKWLYLASTILQWIFIPITTTLFGALPGIDAQTRLMLGKYLGFRVTEKKASTQPV